MHATYRICDATSQDEVRRPADFCYIFVYMPGDAPNSYGWRFFSRERSTAPACQTLAGREGRTPASLDGEVTVPRVSAAVLHASRPPISGRTQGYPRSRSSCAAFAAEASFGHPQYVMIFLL